MSVEPAMSADPDRPVGHLLDAELLHEPVAAGEPALSEYILEARGVPWLLDFDRGRIRPPGAWRERNLDRLLRSLRKIRLHVAEEDYPEPQWRWLLAGYAASLA